MIAYQIEVFMKNGCGEVLKEIWLEVLKKVLSVPQSIFLNGSMSSCHWSPVIIVL
jgi:hypothetical protein